MSPSVLPGQETLLASWRALARLSPGARIDRDRLVVTAVFRSCAPLNNAIVLHGGGLAAAGRAARRFRETGVDV